LGALLLASGLGLARLRVDDSLTLLYAHDAALEDEEVEVGRLCALDGGGGGSFFLVGAASEEGLLRLEEAALDRLDASPRAGTWTGVARLLPSLQRQAADRAAVEEALFGRRDLAGTLQRSLGAPGLKARLRRTFGPPPPPLLPQIWLASPVSQPYRYLWRGPSGGVYHGLLVSTSPVDTASAARAQAALDGLAGIHYVNPPREVAERLGRLRQVLSWALAGGALVVLLLLWLALRRAAWAAALPTALGALAALGALGWLGLAFNLFALLGLILLLGTGIDFGIYLQATGPRLRSSFVAVNLAALTNLAAVGVLAFSSTAAFRSFGLVLAVGAGVAWLTAPCFRSTER
jgi:predicted exporter